MSKKYQITCLPGDGIGPEIVEATKVVLNAVAAKFGFILQFNDYAFGGAGIDKYGNPYADEVRNAVLNCDAVFLGSVGGPKWDNAEVRPEAGLLAMRKSLDVFANVRPLQVVGALTAHSPLKKEIAEGVDLVIVRELSSGAYFGTPRHLNETDALDSITYTQEEIDRVVHYAFQMAEKRRKKLCSVDKANVLASSKLWRKRVLAIAEKYPSVEISHEYVDAMAMHLITRPKDFDVIVTENLFGDILSDEASVLGGSLGVLPSASFNSKGPFLYEPAHGSAPDIAGRGIANPIATMLSGAMMLRYSFSENEAADLIEAKIAEMMQENRLTVDLNRENPLTTNAFTAELIKKIETR
ncbi:MAG: 3-isopropylmalate dehydrogenase [Cardiobacteriaceae bacterium]|nr:3-isopropylmalate dehydrogenase [Cardiobacteriaceae bacterium]